MARKTARKTAAPSGPGDSAPPSVEAATASPAEAPPRDLLDEAAAASGPAVPSGEPVPLEVPLEEQITKLPPLTYPGSTNEEFDQWAADKRRNRLRLELIGAAILLFAGVIISAISGRPAFAVVAVFGIAGLAVYEFLVTSFE